MPFQDPGPIRKNEKLIITEVAPVVEEPVVVETVEEAEEPPATEGTKCTWIHSTTAAYFSKPRSKINTQSVLFLHDQ